MMCPNRQQQPRPSRFGEYTGATGRNGIDDRASNTVPSLGQTLGGGSKGWSDSIWSNGSLSAAGFGSATRDNSRTRGKAELLRCILYGPTFSTYNLMLPSLTVSSDA